MFLGASQGVVEVNKTIAKEYDTVDSGSGLGHWTTLSWEDAAALVQSGGQESHYCQAEAFLKARKMEKWTKFSI